MENVVVYCSKTHDEMHFERCAFCALDERDELLRQTLPFLKDSLETGDWKDAVPLEILIQDIENALRGD